MRPRLEPGQWWIRAYTDCHLYRGDRVAHFAFIQGHRSDFIGPWLCGCALRSVQRSRDGRGGLWDVPRSGLLPGVSAQRGGGGCLGPVNPASGSTPTRLASDTAPLRGALPGNTTAAGRGAAGQGGVRVACR